VTVFLLFLLILLVFVNGFFVATEFALVRSRRSQIEALVEEGSRGATQAIRSLDRIDEYLSAAQIGITMASIGLGFLGEPALAELIEPIFGGVMSHGIAIAIAVAIAYTIVTAAHVIVGEQAPKMMAITKSERVLQLTAIPFEWFRLLFRPVIWALNGSANFVVTRILGIKIEGDLEQMTSEELRQLVSRGRQLVRRGAVDPTRLDAGEVDMLAGVFHLHEQEARQVMTPIPAVVTVNVVATAEEALRECVGSGHTRLLVIEEDNPDRVRGIVHANALARSLLADGPGAPVEPLVREVPILPETKPLDDLLAELQRQRSSLAVIADEYGRTAGIVTVEDIIEEIVGEIVDETDPVLSPVRRLVNGDWFVRGHVSLDDLKDNGVELPVEADAGYTSVGGYVFDQLGRLPKRGDEITKDGYRIRVESVRQNRVEAVRIRPSAMAAG
jgi:CBS domain containing-hemolysin-like protein